MKCKNAVLFLIVGIFMTASSFSQVGIGTTNPNASSGLDVDFTDKGLLPPRMTTVQRNAISNPAEGLMIFNITTGCLNYFHSNVWYELFGILSGSIGSLDCISATIEGTLTEGVLANGVSALVPYTGGNGQYYAGQTVNSTVVTGLTASLNTGGFNMGSGDLIYTITGTPVSSGTATFELNIGGQTCTIGIPVAVPFSCGTSAVTFNYNGSSVNYGTVVGANNRCWLNRNLGATQVATFPNDAAAYGDLFQWGRLDDGHQIRTSATTTTLSNSDVPGHGSFILAPSSPYDWRSPQNPNLWQGVNGINNPCPSGFRLPIEAEWQTEVSSWSPGNAAGAFASPLKLTLTAMRDGSNGIIFAENVHGTYWSSTVIGTESRRLGFDSNIAGIFTSSRNIGQSVRCIKD